MRENPKDDFCKYIGYIHLEVIYGKKECRIWGGDNEYDHGDMTGQIQREVCEKTNLLKLRVISIILISVNFTIELCHLVPIYLFIVYLFEDLTLYLL